GGPDAGGGDFVNQSGDVSFVITQLLDASRTTEDPLAARIADGDIAALGHSLGGPAVIGLTRKNCCRDERVRASILVATAWELAVALGPDPIAPAGPPTVIIHGTADMTVAYSTALQLYEMLLPPRLLVAV